MDYVRVTVIAPNGKTYSAKVDKDAEEKTLVSDLVEGLRLPRTTKDGRNKIKYGISVINGARIRKDVTIQIYEVKPRTAIDIEPM
jgi:hypothetical protein